MKKPEPNPKLEQLRVLIPKLDLRGITRYSEICHTSVTLYWDFDTTLDWIVCGQAELRQRDRNDGVYGGTSTLSAYMDKGITDFEHDSAHAFGLPLIGLKFDNLFYHQTILHAWIDPNEDPLTSNSFRVPQPGYDPAKIKGTVTCKYKRCGGPHLIVPEGFYYPPHNADLYKLVKGKRVEIRIGPVYPEEKE